MRSQTGTSGWRASYRASEHDPESMSSGQDPMDGCRFSDKIIFEQKSKTAGGSTPLSMIRTRRAALAQSGNRFSEKIMLKQRDEISCRSLAASADSRAPARSG